jgi:MarR family transcriptional regulator, lower aerobic nicotinate degradation pathway regulator
MPGQEPIGLLVAATRRRIKQAVSVLVGSRDLSPQQFWVVVAVAESEGLSLSELAQCRHMDQPTASRVVYGLVRRKLLRASIDPADRRCVLLMLTAGGRRLARQLLPIARKIHRTIERSLQPAERRAVVSGLQKVLGSLDRLEAAAGASR